MTRCRSMTPEDPLFFLSACTTPTPSVTVPVSLPTSAASSEPNMIQLDSNSNGKQINAAPNQTIVIILDSNPTTGFKWNLITGPDAKILEFVSSDYQAVGTPIPGCGGREMWNFKTIAAGTTTLKLQCFRPFDVKTIGGEFKLTVQVKMLTHPR